jgi:hypothetical protein
MGTVLIVGRGFQQLLQQLFKRLDPLLCSGFFKQLQWLDHHLLRARFVQQLIEQRMDLLLRAGFFQQLLQQRLDLLCAGFFKQLLQRMLACQLLQQRLLACQQLFQRMVLEISRSTR